MPGLVLEAQERVKGLLGVAGVVLEVMREAQRVEACSGGPACLE